MICLECEKLDLKGNPRHAAVGLGQCGHQKLSGVFVSFTNRRECQQFKAAPAAQAEARKTWWAKIESKDRAELAHKQGKGN